MSQAENFIWCTAGCGSGQIHDSNNHHPIVTCLHCEKKSCFVHNVPWHEGVSCREYNRILEDPEYSSPRVEKNAPSARRERNRDGVDGMTRRSATSEDAVGRHRDFKRKQRRDREKLEEAAVRLRENMFRRRRDEVKSAETIRRTTKPCPGCGTSIEKSSGW
jgi:hypothetical protein